MSSEMLGKTIKDWPFLAFIFISSSVLIVWHLELLELLIRDTSYKLTIDSRRFCVLSVTAIITNKLFTCFEIDVEELFVNIKVERNKNGVEKIIFNKKRDFEFI